jgi:hypothetical protein
LREQRGLNVELAGKWCRDIVREVFSAVRGDLFWERYLEGLAANAVVEQSLHLAVLKEPYLEFILRGEKTVESRFSRRRCAPYNVVTEGDVLILKRQSGPVLGLCRVAQAWFYELDPGSWKTIREDFTAALRAEDPEFWRDREGASFATLMSIDQIKRLPAIGCGKRDRRGWVLLRKAMGGAELWNLQASRSS